MLVSGLSAAGVIEIAERLRHAAGAAPVMTGADEIEVRISIGVAQRRDDASLGQILQRAGGSSFSACEFGHKP